MTEEGQYQKIADICDFLVTAQKRLDKRLLWVYTHNR